MTVSALSKAKQLLRSLLGLFPLTAQGCITLVVAATALNVFAYGAMDLVVFALAICALAILVFCLFNTVIVGVLMQRKIRREHAANTTAPTQIKVEAGFPNETGFKLPSPTFLPLVRLNWKITYPDFISTRADFADGKFMREEIIPQKRCLSSHVIRQFSVSDVLGFCRFSWFQKQDCELMALPQTNSVKQLPLLRSLTAEDGIPNPSGEPEGDRMEIRPYAPGDSVKNIMWKVFARNRQLNVRLPENSVFHSNRTVAYLLSSDNDEAAAAVARIALESGALGEDWQFGADGTNEVCTSVPTALQALARSRALDQAFAYGLDQFLHLSNGQGAHCIVFAAAEQAPWLAQIKNTIARHSGQFSIVLATDGMEREEPLKLWQKLLFIAPERVDGDSAENSSLGKIQHLLTEIGQLVESTWIVDRKTGSSFDRYLCKV
ncbi:MAG: DUF58 domain-containing protein [Pseudomonadales bacterium]|nr:DUF58 domain-containing protein [Pseudomonadales bacterium]